MDGQGLGHTPDLSGSVSTHTTERFEEVDLILVFDNATTGVPAATLSLLRVLATSGHDSKAAIAFTHVDEVNGPNLPTIRDKRNHVLSSLHNGISKLKEAVLPSAIGNLERKLEERTFLFGGIDHAFESLPKGPRQELERLLKLCREVAKQTIQRLARPVYDTGGLLFAIQTATNDFHNMWNARLGFRWADGIDKEHWKRVQALSRRLAFQTDVEYLWLQPLSDFIVRVQEGIAKFVEKPTAWDPPADNAEAAEESLGQVRREVFKALHVFARSRLVADRFQEWVSAYNESGRGSAQRRATLIRTLFENAAPIPGIAMTESASEFTEALRELARNAIRKAGGIVKA